MVYTEELYVVSGVLIIRDLGLVCGFNKPHHLVHVTYLVRLVPGHQPSVRMSRSQHIPRFYENAHNKHQSLEELSI